jgi:hypothetical protein
MRVLGWLVRLGLALVWAGMALVAVLVLLVCWPFVRPPRRHAPVDITGKPFPDIIIEDGAAREASPAPRLADMTFEDIQQLREELDDA